MNRLPSDLQEVYQHGRNARIRGESHACCPYSETAASRGGDERDEHERRAFVVWSEGWEWADGQADVCPVRYSRPAGSVSEAMIRAT